MLKKQKERREKCRSGALELAQPAKRKVGDM